MSTSVGSIHYDLDLNTAKFTASANKVKAQMASMSSSISTSGKSIENSNNSAGSSFAGVAGKATVVAGAVLAVGVAVKSIVVPMIGLASEAENLRASLDVLTGSAEAGRNMYKSLTDFAAKTPFETTELVEASKMMLSYGISTEKILPSLRMMGDISMGNKEKLAGLTYAFSQVQATGRLMGQDLLQMVNAGFNPLQEISKKTGESMIDLKKRMEDGGISAQEVADAMASATAEGGRFYGGMDKGSKTLSGRMSTLKDNAKMALRALMGIDEGGGIKAGGLYDSISKAVEKLGPWLEKLATDYAPRAGQAIADLITKTTKFFEENKWAVEAVKLLAMALGVILASGLITVAGLIVLPIMAFNWLKSVTISLWQTIYSVFSAISNFISSVFNTIYTVTSSVWSSIYGFIYPVLNLIKNIFTIVFGGIFLVVLNVTRNINDVVVSVFNGVYNFIAGIWNSIRAVIVNVVNSIISFFYPAWSWLYGAGRNVIQGLINGIGAMAGGLWNTIAWVSGHIGRFFAGAGGWLWGVGVAIIQGLLGGMSAMAGAVFNKAQEIANGITSRIRSALSVRSPSRVMMGIGGNVAEGLVIGIQKGMSSVENISANMANAVIQPVANAPAPVGNTSTTTIQMGDIHIADNATADYFFSKLNRNNELVQKGLTTI